jgi:hypothetical protein
MLASSRSPSDPSVLERVSPLYEESMHPVGYSCHKHRHGCIIGRMHPLAVALDPAGSLSLSSSRRI